jgi:hypothetical protein
MAKIRAIYNSQRQEVKFPVPRWRQGANHMPRKGRVFKATPASWERLSNVVASLSEDKFEVVRGLFDDDWVVLEEEYQWRFDKKVSN